MYLSQRVLGLHIAVSDGGMQLAYTVTRADHKLVSVHVYDAPSGLVRVAELSASDTAAFGDWGAVIDFAPAGDAVVFGVPYFENGQEPLGWDFHVWTLPANSITHTLSSMNAAVGQNFEVDPSRRFLPMAANLGTDWVEIGLVPWGTAAYGGENLVWVLSSGAVYLGGAGGYPGVRLEATAEQAYASYDSEYTSCQCGVMLEFNVIKIFDIAAPREYVALNEMRVSLGPVAWIEDGARLAFAAPDNDQTVMRVMALDRAGAVEELGTFEYTWWYQIKGVVDGALIEVSTEDSVQLYHFSSADPGGAPRLVWETSYTETESTPRLAWATPPQASTAMQAFAEVTPILLAVGGQAVINSSENSPVNMRSGAGTNTSVVTQLAAGALVDVIGGPATDDVDYLTWWEVRAIDGATGWVAESIWEEDHGLRLLVPMN